LAQGHLDGCPGSDAMSFEALLKDQSAWSQAAQDAAAVAAPAEKKPDPALAWVNALQKTLAQEGAETERLEALTDSQALRIEVLQAQLAKKPKTDPAQTREIATLKAELNLSKAARDENDALRQELKDLNDRLDAEIAAARAEAAARIDRARELAFEAVQHATELQRLVDQQQREAMDYEQQREAIRQYQDTVAAEIAQLENTQPAALLEALTQATHDLEIAGQHIQAKDQEIGELREQIPSEAVVPAAVAEELRSTLAATRADLGQRTAEVTSLREELRAVALKVQMAKEDAGRVLELGHVEIASQSQDPVDGTSLVDMVQHERARSGKYAGMVETLMRKLEEERAAQAQLAADAGMLRSTVSMQKAQIETYESQLKQRSRKEEAALQKEHEALVGAVEAETKLIEEEHEYQQKLKQLAAEDRAAGEQLLQDAVGADKIFSATAVLQLAKDDEEQLRISEEREKALQTQRLELERMVEENERAVKEMEEKMTKKTADSGVLEREIKLLQNRVKAETKEKEELAAKVTAKQKEVEEIKRQMKIVQVNSEKVIGSLQRQIGKITHGSVKSPYNAPPIGLRRFDGTVPEKPKALPASGKYELQSH